MNSFDILAQELADSPSSYQLFFRDDDAGWADERLSALSKTFKQYGIPLDIAVIPAALAPDSVDLLKSMIDDQADLFHLHQHGWSHSNHQLEGRSCEFGTDRSFTDQVADIARGQEILRHNFQDAVEPIFTPPWNRCTSVTAQALSSLGFKALSRIAGSEQIECTIQETPVTVDWLKKKKGHRLPTDEVIGLVIQALRAYDEPVGIMLHHEQMDDSNRAVLAQLIEVLQASNKIEFISMQQLVQQNIRPDCTRIED